MVSAFTLMLDGPKSVNAGVKNEIFFDGICYEKTAKKEYLNISHSLKRDEKRWLQRLKNGPKMLFTEVLII